MICYASMSLLTVSSISDVVFWHKRNTDTKKDWKIPFKIKDDDAKWHDKGRIFVSTNFYKVKCFFFSFIFTHFSFFSIFNEKKLCLLQTQSIILFFIVNIRSHFLCLCPVSNHMKRGKNFTKKLAPILHVECHVFETIITYHQMMTQQV